MLKDLSAILYSPEVSLKVAQILGHNKRFQAKAEKEPEIALKYAETVKKAKIKDIEKAIKRHFKKNPSEKEVEYLIKISSHPRVKEKRIVNTIRSKKDLSLLKTYVNSNKNANVELVNKMAAASVKRNPKKGYMMTAAYVNENNKVVVQDIADLIYGKDENIKNEKKAKKEKYLENVNNILLNIANAQKIAENSALEESKITQQIFNTSKEEITNLDLIDDSTFYKENKEAVEMAREALYNDYIAKERDKSKQEIEGIRSQFPNEKAYEKYVNEIRQTKAYQKAYAKYKKMYAEAKQNLTKEAIETVKSNLDTESKKETLDRSSGVRQKPESSTKESAKPEEEVELIK